MASAGSSANAGAAAKFWTYFQEQKECVKSMAANNQDASQKVRELDIALREAFIYLPAYDQKHFIKDLEELRGLIHKRSEPKRFGFRFKTASAPKTTKTKGPEGENQQLDALQGSSSTTSADSAASRSSPSLSCVFADVADSWITAELPSEQEATGASPTDGELRDVSNSVVDLRPISGKLRALNCHRLANAIVICGPFSGSATIRDSSNCILIMGVRQFRLENSRSIDIYLHCTSHPIIEKSSGIRFSSYPSALLTDQTQQDFANSKLLDLPNSFDKVDDFNWLKRQASPNWSINAAAIADGTWSLANGSSRPLKALLELLPDKT